MTDQTDDTENYDLLLLYVGDNSNYPPVSEFFRTSITFTRDIKSRSLKPVSKKVKKYREQLSKNIKKEMNKYETTIPVYELIKQD